MGINEKEAMDMKTSLLAGIIACLLLTLPAAASDYTLEIFGNANEDDTINMQDVTYTELIILEYRDKTELADAKHDGKINMQDVTQIELVILGKEKEMTLLDMAGRVVTVNKPITKIASFSHGGEHIQIIKAIRAEEKIVAVDSDLQSYDFLKVLYPEISKLPDFGTSKSVDYEVLFEIKPDLVTKMGVAPLNELKPADQEIADTLKSGGIDIIFLGSRHPEELLKSARKLGYLLDRREEADEFIDFYEELINTIAERTKSIPEGDKLRVYVANCDKYRTAGVGTGYSAYLEMAGGRSISAEAGVIGAYTQIDPEWLIEENPDVFVMRPTYYIFPDYGSDDPAEASEVRDDILNTPELANVKAIEDERVHLFGVSSTSAASFLCIGYMAKWFYPELFEDLDMKAIHQDYLDRFQRLDFDVDEHGVFMYPALYGPALTQ
ncbi:MAG: ABC transporter substrate-binding protein [Euryarchaeota archaeon]|nr:ABC transporter substrate-binding protein [Euryarchaeota archaeon]